MLPQNRWRLNVLWWTLIIVYMFFGISYYSLNWLGLLHGSQNSRRLMIMLASINFLITMWWLIGMVPHVTLWSPFILILYLRHLIKRVSLVIVGILFYFLRRASLNDSSILMLHLVSWLVIVIILLMILLMHRLMRQRGRSFGIIRVIIVRRMRHICVRVRWVRILRMAGHRWIIRIIVHGWLIFRSMASINMVRLFIICLVLSWMQVALKRLIDRILSVVIWVVKMKSSVVRRIGDCCWGWSSIAPRSIVAIIEFRIILSLSSVCRCCGSGWWASIPLNLLLLNPLIALVIYTLRLQCWQLHLLNLKVLLFILLLYSIKLRRILSCLCLLGYRTDWGNVIGQFFYL